MEHPGVDGLLDALGGPSILPVVDLRFVICEICGAVYRINCGGGQEDEKCHRSYVGDAERTLVTRTQKS